MHKKSFEVVEFDGEIDEMLGEDTPVVKTTNGDQEGYVYNTNKTSLSTFAKEVKQGNRKERRAEAKRIRKAFK